MPSLGLAVANDIANAALKFYARGKAIAQTIQDKPLLGFLQSGKKDFPGGNLYVSEPVQGAYMASTAGFFAGISEDDQLAFTQAANLLRAEYPWKEVHAGLIITWTELKKDGISIVEDQKTSEHSDVALTRLTGLLQNRMDDYGESWARSMNSMLWGDGVADSKQIPGLQAILPFTDNATATVGGLSQATYEWWRHYVVLNIAPSAENQVLVETLVATLRQLKKRGGKPNKALCGSKFLAALRTEKRKGLQYSNHGVRGKTDLGDGGESLAEVGDFIYDPTMDDIGLDRYCVVLDGRRCTLRPMEMEWNKVITPERPYNYFVFLKSMTCTGALQMTQMNCHAVFSVAA